MSVSLTANRTNRRARGAVENAAAVEIDSSGLRQLLFDDFHELLGKAFAKNASAFPHLPQPRRRRLINNILISVADRKTDRPLKAVGKLSNRQGALKGPPQQVVVPLPPGTSVQIASEVLAANSGTVRL